MNQDSKPRQALVTGGTGGLGTAICTVLDELGFHVFANYFPADESNAMAWQQRQAEAGRNMTIIPADVSNFEECEQMAATIKAQGTLSVIVNNAGIARDTTLKNMAPHQWQSVLDTNLGGMFNVTRQFVESMSDTGFGRIVNISSINGQRGQFGQTNYSAAKAGVHGFTMALAQETARKGITVNTISPGFIDTDMVKSIPEAQRLALIDSIPVGRVGQPEDIAQAVAFLISDNSGYITGNDLCVNGGIFMH